jgi:hypothetical protein
VIRRRCYCCTDFPPRRACTSRSWRGSPIAIASSHPDYPGFGHSDAPDPKNFAYSFDRLAQVIERFTQALGLTRYTLFLQDYGGPVGFEKKFRISQRRDRWPKIGSRQEKVSAGAKPPTSKPANCGPLASTQGNLRFERLRGGLGRTRTSNQTVMGEAPIPDGSDESDT